LSIFSSNTADFYDLDSGDLLPNAFLPPCSASRAAHYHEADVAQQLSSAYLAAHGKDGNADWRALHDSKGRISGWAPPSALPVSRRDSVSADREFPARSSPGLPPVGRRLAEGQAGTRKEAKMLGSTNKEIELLQASLSLYSLRDSGK
jgi:hypothetical protein